MKYFEQILPKIADQLTALAIADEECSHLISDLKKRISDNYKDEWTLSERNLIVGLILFNAAGRFLGEDISRSSYKKRRKDVSLVTKQFRQILSEWAGLKKPSGFIKICFHHENGGNHET